MRWLAVAALAGCLPDTQVARPTSQVVDRTMSAAVVTATDPVRATAMVADTAVVVTAIQPRSCRRTVYDTVERASRRTQIIAAVVDRPCALPAANTRLHITLASGTVVDGTTDERGELVVVLPVSEPAGDVTVVVDQRGR